MNRAIFVGNLTRDPESRTTPNGVPVCTFTVAVQRRFSNQQGEREADFLPVVCWRGLAETCSRYLHKGNKVGVVGSIQTRNYEANDGTKRYVTEIVADEGEFLTPKGQSGSDSGYEPQYRPAPAAAPRNSDSSPVAGSGLYPSDDDDLPF